MAENCIKLTKLINQINKVLELKNDITDQALIKQIELLK
jgi:hypothetical protein